MRLDLRHDVILVRNLKARTQVYTLNILTLEEKEGAGGRYFALGAEERLKIESADLQVAFQVDHRATSLQKLKTSRHLHT